MRQRAAQRRLCYVLHAASAPAPSVLEQPDMLIVAPGPQLILPITSCNALSVPPPALLRLHPVLSVCSTGKTDVREIECNQVQSGGFLLMVFVCMLLLIVSLNVPSFQEVMPTDGQLSNLVEEPLAG